MNAIILEDACVALERRLQDDSELSPSDSAFLAWLLRHSFVSDLATLANEAIAAFPSGRSYHHLSILGYGLHAGVVDQTTSETLRGGLTWLCGRSANIDGEPAPFVTDGVALLGIALGARSLGDLDVQPVRAWLLEFLPEAAKLPAVEPWQRCLFALALKTLASDELPLFADADSVDVRVALGHLVGLAPPDATISEEDERLVLTALKEQRSDALSPVRAGLRLAAYRWICRTSPTIATGRLTPTDVVALLNGVPAGLRRWAWEATARTRGGKPRKWHVDNEYHVQDMLYLVLAPVFPDLTDEEYVPSLGQKQPRTDLFIPSMRLIIEAKFLRATGKFTTVIDEVASDASLYLKDGSDYSGLIAVVWDDSRRTEEHTKLREGLRAIRGLLDAVIIPRPGGMVDDSE